jgi:hypothetical protein
MSGRFRVSDADADTEILEILTHDVVCAWDKSTKNVES